MKTALVYGAGGFLGNAMCNRLKEEGYWVRGVDLKRPEFSETVCDEFIVGDLRDEGTVSRTMFAPNQRTLKYDPEAFTRVYSYAACMGGALWVFTGDQDAEIIHDSALINLHTAHYASKFGVKKLFFSSSACAYGEDIQLNTDSPALKESQIWKGGKPDSVYGVEKLIAEDIYDSYRRNHGLNVRMARFHNIFGEYGTYEGNRAKAPGALARKVASCPDGGTIEVLGDGQQKRSFLHVSECTAGVQILMDSECQKTLNIGSNEMVSINQLAEMLIKISGKNISIKNIQSNALGVRGRNSDNTLCQQELGWSPSKPLQEGLEKLYYWVEKQVNP